jgi:pimeloyl-ACP methyl ester carboxylesterase
VIAAGCSERAREAADLLSDISAGEGPSRLKRETPAPERRPSAYPGGFGDLYVSPRGAAAALVLVPGLARTGKDDPRLVAFATSLARVRFAVLVPDVDSLRALKVRPTDIDAVADAALWLSDQAHLTGGHSVGIVAISYAAGPALLAATTPRARDRVGFVVTVGGYHDINKVVRFFTTGAYRLDGRWRHAEPNAYGKWVFVKSNAERLDEPADRARLVDIADAKLDDPAADIAAAASDLGSDGKSVLALADNTDRDQVAALVADLPAAIRDDMAALDPATAPLENASARLILIHGRDDTIIPFSESIDLAGRLGPDRASLYLVDGLWHADANFTLRDRWILWDAAIELLELRDRL